MYLLDVISHFYLSLAPAHFHAAASRTVSQMRDSHMYNPQCARRGESRLVAAVKGAGSTLCSLWATGAPTVKTQF